MPIHIRICIRIRNRILAVDFYFISIDRSVTLHCFIFLVSVTGVIIFNILTYIEIFWIIL